MALIWLGFFLFKTIPPAAGHSGPEGHYAQHRLSPATRDEIKNLNFQHYLIHSETTPPLFLAANVGASDAKQSDTIPKVKRPSDPWFAEDKFAHFALSLTLTGASYHLIRCRLNQSDPRATVYSLGFSFGCGLGKEIWDSTRPKNHFSYKDLLYDVLGIGAGYLLFIHQFP